MVTSHKRKELIRYLEFIILHLKADLNYEILTSERERERERRVGIVYFLPFEHEISMYGLGIINKGNIILLILITI